MPFTGGRWEKAKHLLIHILYIVIWPLTMAIYGLPPHWIFISIIPYLIVVALYLYYTKDFIEYVALERYYLESELPYFIAFIKYVSNKIGLLDAVKYALNSNLFPTIARISRGVEKIEELSEILVSAGYPYAGHLVNSLYQGFEEPLKQAVNRYGEVLNLYNDFRRRLYNVIAKTLYLTMAIPIYWLFDYVITNNIPPTFDWILYLSASYIGGFIILSITLYFIYTFLYQPYTPGRLVSRLGDYYTYLREHLIEILGLIGFIAGAILVYLYLPVLTPFTVTSLFVYLIYIGTNFGYNSIYKISSVIRVLSAETYDRIGYAEMLNHILNTYSLKDYLRLRLEEAYINVKTGLPRTGDPLLNHVLIVSYLTGGGQAFTGYTGFLQVMESHYRDTVSTLEPAYYGITLSILYPLIYGVIHIIGSATPLFRWVITSFGRFMEASQIYDWTSTGNSFEEAFSMLDTVNQLTDYVFKALDEFLTMDATVLTLLFTALPFLFLSTSPVLKPYRFVVIAILSTVSLLLLSFFTGFLTFTL